MANENDERIPVEQLYGQQYVEREWEAFYRMTLEQRITPQGVPVPEPVPVDVSPESLQSSAEGAAQLPEARANAIRTVEDLKKEPTLRDAVNNTLGVVFGAHCGIRRHAPLARRMQHLKPSTAKWNSTRKRTAKRRTLATCR